MGVAGGTIERSCYSPHYANTERDYEKQLINGRNTSRAMRETTRQLCLRAAQQQTGASPVTAVSIGSGSAALIVQGNANQIGAK